MTLFSIVSSNHQNDLSCLKCRLKNVAFGSIKLTKISKCVMKRKIIKI